jgi:hypothetical protein
MKTTRKKRNKGAGLKLKRCIGTENEREDLGT